MMTCLDRISRRTIGSACLALISTLAGCNTGTSSNDLFLIPSDQQNIETFSEVEPNGNVDEAAANNGVTIRVGRTFLDGELDDQGDDVDGFLITIPPQIGKALTFKLEMNEASNLDLFLFEVRGDGSLVPLGSSTKDGSKQERIVAPLLDRVSYYAEIRRVYGAKAFYTLTIQR